MRIPLLENPTSLCAIEHNAAVPQLLAPDFWPRLCDFHSENVFNPWADSDPLDLPFATACERRIHLRSHFDVDAKYLLIGEAPGYRGCHFSGIPFTCEKQLVNGEVPRIRAS